MGKDVRYLQLIDMAPVYAALDVPPGGGLWTVVATNRREETGSASCQIAVIASGQTDILQYRGPTVVGLGDAQLEIERERLCRVRAEAETALRAIDNHLAFRRGR